MALVGCRSAPERAAGDSSERSSPDPHGRSEEAAHPAPGTCQIVATVVEIEPKQQNAASDDPCAVYSCRARVRLESITMCGSGFPHKNGPGDTLSVHFAFTTGPATADTHPNLEVELPGLNAGDRIAATLHADPEPGVSQWGYSIYLYESL